MAISQNFPEEGPTLNLNFAGSKVLDPRITFSRSSVGTYMDDNGLLKTAAADEPRFDHDDVTGESLGLLIEESRTNLIPYSAVNTTNWNFSGQTPVSLSLNALGVFPGVRAISNGQVWHGLHISNISLTSGTTYTATWYFRKGDINPSNKFRAIIRDVPAAKVTTFEKSSASTDYGDISSYSFSQNTDVTTNFEYLSVDTLADGLTYKLCIRFNASASSDYRFMFQTNSATVGETIIALGLQVEEGEFPTSYIPTSGSTVTRDPDNVTMTGTNFSNITTGISKMVVGARGVDSDKGAAYIYDMDGSNEIKITASDGVAGDQFGGEGVAIANNKIVVSAYKRDIGAVYVYDLDGTNEIKITASDGSSGDEFGRSVAIGSNKIVVGAYAENSNRGAVYVYDLDGTNEVKITASDAAVDDFFGHAVGIGNNKIVVGAYGDDDNGSSSGSAYIYDLDGTNEVKITASDGSTSDNFGAYKVSIGANKIIIGSYADDDDGSLSGSAYIYDLDGSNEVKITASDAAGGDLFGLGVFIGEGSVGTPNWYNQDEGTVYVSQKLRAVQDTVRNNVVYMINGGNQFDFYYNTKAGGNHIFVFGDGGTIYRSFGKGGINSIDSKTAWAYDVSSDDFKAYYNGIEATNETNNNTPSATSHTKLELGSTATAKYCGHIQQFVYYQTRLSNAQLQNLTK